MMSSTNDKQEDWRIRAEAKRKAALEIRARNKKRKEEEEEQEKNAASQAFNGKGSPPSVAVAAAALTPAAKKPVVNPYKSCTRKKTPEPKAAATATVTPKSPEKKAALPKPSLPPPITSSWGDCRLDLWEATCTCGGEQKSPDVRMCRCLAALNAGLGCTGCNAGVLLIKSGPRGFFWGCSNYKKKGCKFTKRFGPPNDAEASRELAIIKQQSMRRAHKAAMEMARISDPFELEWRSTCRCDGAKALDTFECFMQSNGGCGMLPICPQGCGGALFLHDSKYASGQRWWGCSNYKKGLCKFRKNYVEHK